MEREKDSKANSGVEGYSDMMHYNKWAIYTTLPHHHWLHTYKVGMLVSTESPRFLVFLNKETSVKLCLRQQLNTTATMEKLGLASTPGTIPK